MKQKCFHCQPLNVIEIFNFYQYIVFVLVQKLKIAKQVTLSCYRRLARTGAERADQPDSRAAGLDFARGRVARKEDGSQARKGKTALTA